MNFAASSKHVMARANEIGQLEGNRKMRIRQRSRQACFVVLFSVMVVVLQAMGFSAAALAVSEETPPTTCGARLMAGIKCSGRYCDNIKLKCGSEFREVWDWQWTKHVSEEHGGEVKCNVPNPFTKVDWPQGEPAFITGMSCNGSYCDNVSLECTALRDYFPSYSDCGWSQSVSEENGGTLNFPAGRFAIAMQCRGSNCDNKKFLLCPIRPR